MSEERCRHKAEDHCGCSAIDKVAHPKKRGMLTAIVECGGSIIEAARKAKIGRTNHYHWLNKDDVYREAVAEAIIRAGDVIESEIKRRGINGTRKPVYYQGERVGFITEYSDTLLLAYANAHPELSKRYRYKQEITHKGDPGTENDVVEELDELAAAIRKNAHSDTPAKK